MAKRRNYKNTSRQTVVAGLVFVLVVLVIGGILLREQVFILRNIQVAGNVNRTAYEISQMSGLTLGRSMFGIDAQAVRENFEAVGDLEIEDVEIQMPNTVLIRVHERVPCARISFVGIYLTVDEDCYVIEQRGDLPAENALPIVTGLMPTFYMVGKQITTQTIGQVRAVSQVLSALRAWGMYDQISDISFADLNNITLKLRSSLSVLLGDEENLTAKLQWASNVIPQLLQEGKTAGRLDVSTGVLADYTPTLGEIQAATAQTGTNGQVAASEGT